MINKKNNNTENHLVKNKIPLFFFLLGGSYRHKATLTVITSVPSVIKLGSHTFDFSSE